MTLLRFSNPVIFIHDRTLKNVNTAGSETFDWQSTVYGLNIVNVISSNSLIQDFYSLQRHP